MKFKKSKEYPDGSVSVTESDLETIKAKGWIVDQHTPYYSNFIGAKTLDIEFGFGAWNSNLEFHISANNEYGGYYTPLGYELKIKSQADLKTAIDIIDTIISLDKKFKSLK